MQKERCADNGCYLAEQVYCLRVAELLMCVEEVHMQGPLLIEWQAAIVFPDGFLVVTRCI